MVIRHSPWKNASRFLTHITVKLSRIVIAIQLTSFLQHQIDTHVALAVKILLVVRRDIKQRITFPSAIKPFRNIQSNITIPYILLCGLRIILLYRIAIIHTWLALTIHKALIAVRNFKFCKFRKMMKR